MYGKENVKQGKALKSWRQTRCEASKSSLDAAMKRFEKARCRRKKKFRCVAQEREDIMPDLADSYAGREMLVSGIISLASGSNL